MSDLFDIYPVIEPHSSGFLEVSDIHKLYWEECGNPDGIPVLVLHGGPGEGCSPTHRRFFDPAIFRIILFDQRGAGRSTPQGELTENNSEALIQDIIKLRKYLGVKQWHLFGGSWGSTLALLYSLEEPDKVLSFLLRGIFLFQQEEIDWFLYGMKRFFPSAWEMFAEHIDDGRHDDLLNAYHCLLNGNDLAAREQAALSWFRYECACALLSPNAPINVNNDALIQQALTIARIETHYFKHAVFEQNDYILSRADKINHIPLTVVQGHYDVICPPITAKSLIDKWPGAEYHLVHNGGHSMVDPAIRSTLIQCTKKLGRINVEQHVI